MFAKEWLIRLLKDPTVRKPCPVKIIIQAAAANEIQKKELKLARKEAGVRSGKFDGVRCWYLPQEDKDA